MLGFCPGESYSAQRCLCHLTKCNWYMFFRTNFFRPVHTKRVALHIAAHNAWKPHSIPFKKHFSPHWPHHRHFSEALITLCSCFMLQSGVYFTCVHEIKTKQIRKQLKKVDSIETQWNHKTTISIHCAQNHSLQRCHDCCRAKYGTLWHKRLRNGPSGAISLPLLLVEGNLILYLIYKYKIINIQCK